MKNPSGIMLLILFCLMLAGGAGYAQQNPYLTRDDSDPEALELLDQLHAFLGKEVLQVEFDLSILDPAAEPLLQNGMAVQQEAMYYVKTDDAEIWCNGKLRWVYLKANREVNLYSAERDEQAGPIQLISEYTGDQYVAALTGTGQVDGKEAFMVELKPVDRNSPLSKVRLSLTAHGSPLQVEIFEKSALRTHLRIRQITVPAKRPESYFTFEPTRYPGVHLEDLRID